MTLTFPPYSTAIFTLSLPIFATTTHPRTFLNDNSDNNDNGKNGDWLYGLTKTEIHPLKIWGRCPGASLPLLSYKSELLTTKSEARHHLLAKGHHTLQGDKQEINLPSVTITEDTIPFTETTPPDVYPEIMQLL